MAIIINGISHSDFFISSLCKTWKELSFLEVKPPEKSRVRTQPPKLIVVHYTGGEGDEKQVMTTLESRALSVHFIINRGGEIFQTCDPMKTVCYHAGRDNNISIGIEVVNYGTRKVLNPFDLSGAPSIARDREVYSGSIDKMKFYFADFYKDQKDSLKKLITILCDKCSIPFRVPVDINGDFLHKRLTREEKKLFSGVCGHYHLSPNKIDPGTRSIEEVGNWLKYTETMRSNKGSK